MINISLPDGSVRSFERPVTGAELAAGIGAGLAKAALAVKVDGEMRDLARPIDKDARVAIVTAKDPDALELAMDELDALRAGGRMVGVISHVAGLQERIRTGIRVEPSEHGSTARVGRIF